MKIKGGKSRVISTILGLVSLLLNTIVTTNTTVQEPTEKVDDRPNILFILANVYAMWTGY